MNSEKIRRFGLLALSAALAVTLAGTGRIWADDGGGDGGGGGHEGGGGGGEDGGGTTADDNEARGLITVDLAGKTVTINSVVLVVADGTRIELQDHNATLSDLSDYVTANPGARAEGEYVSVSSQLVATEIHIEGDGEHGGPGGVQGTRVQGTLNALDAVGSSVTIDTAGGPVTLTLDANTRYEVDDAALTLDQLVALIPADSHPEVKALYDTATSVVLKLKVDIEVETEDDEVVGADSHSLLMRPLSAAAASKTKFKPSKVQLLPGTVVIRAGTVVKPKSLKKGDHVRVASFAAGKRRIAPLVTVTQPRGH